MKLSLLNPPPEVTSALDAIVSELETVRAQISALQAEEAKLLHGSTVVAEAAAEAAQREGLVSLTLRSGRSCGNREMAYRLVCSEIGAALHESDRTVASKMGRATTLITEYPTVYSALTEGKISIGHANTIIDAGDIIVEENVRGKYEKRALEFAEVESVGRLRLMVKEFSELYADVSIEERYEHANAGRNVVVVDGDDGMADIIAHIPGVLAHGIKDRLDQLAHHLVAQRSSDGTQDSDGAGPCPAPELPVDERPMAQLRADVFTDMLLTGDVTQTPTSGKPAGDISARVQLVVPVARLIGTKTSCPTATPTPLADFAEALDIPGFTQPASLVGYGPISAEDARALATNTSAAWEQINIDAETGNILSVTTYRPSAALRRFLGARDLHCRFMGCRMPLRKCDIDHTIDAALGGPTSSDNLGYLCRRHHTLKHATSWKVSQDATGVYVWESPTGRSYADRPESSVRFRPTTDGKAEVDALIDASSAEAATATARFGPMFQPMSNSKSGPEPKPESPPKNRPPGTTRPKKSREKPGAQPAPFRDEEPF